MNLSLLIEGAQAPNAALLVNRVALGVFFAISGYHKLFIASRRAELKHTLQDDGVHVVQVMRWLLPGGEFAGGSALILGLLAVPAAFGLFVICVGAIALDAVKRIRAWQPIDRADWLGDLLYLPESLYCVGLAVVMLAGPGRWSLDARLGVYGFGINYLESSMNNVQVAGGTYEMPPREGFTVAYFITVTDIDRSLRFYEKVFGGRILSRGDSNGAPGYIQIANTWLIVNVGGGPTPDKPTVILSVLADKDKVDSFMNFRVADIRACYELWKSRGAQFITEPKDKYGETRCYIRDPDGYIIEVGQTKPEIAYG